MAGSKYLAPASIPLTVTAADSDGTVAKVEYYQGTTLIATSTTAPFAATWANAPAGTYSLTAKATDNSGGVATSAATSITVNATNTAPTVSLTAPAANASVTLPATVTLSANASGVEANTPITKVNFYQGTTLVGSDTTAPYSLSWTPTTAGTYSLTAKATDSGGAVTTSAAVSITVKATNTAPTVSLTGPVAGSKYLAPASIPLTVTAADSDGTVAKVEYYQGATLVATSTTAPFGATWANAPAGTYSLTAKATDNSGSVTTSAAVSVTVNATNTAPTVSLTAPAANASVTLPATVTLSANASGVEANTPITKVDFYQGTTLVGSDTTAPYSLSWTPTVAGSYSLTAKATDSGGATTTSAAVSITVKTAVTAIYYIQGDHLGTPRIVTDSAKNVVWRNHPLSEPFGLSPVEEDPDADGQKFVLNLRFAGQYYDKETGTHYNVQRDYDPAAGRYLQSDPIGLAGGANTYAYVGSNPLQFVDPWGLAKCDSTEPNLPPKQIAEGNGVKVEHYYRSDDHAPAHAHVVGGGRTTRIGANGKPLAGDPELSSAQRAVINENKSAIRKSVNKIGRWLDYKEGQ